MKKLTGILLALLMAATTWAQQVEIGAYAGYVPGSKTMYTYDGYRLRISDSGNFSASLGISTPAGVAVEFNFMQYSSTLSQDGGIIDVVETQPINVQYYQLGVLRPLTLTNENLIPFGLVAVGASHFNPTRNPADYWRFAFSLGLGLKYFFTPAIGIRLQARVLMPMYFGGLGFGCGIGTGGAGCGGGAAFGSEIIQADFTGGVVLRLGKQ